jgi:predicted dehydrogenase
VGEVKWAWGTDVRCEPGGDPTLDAFFQFEIGAGGHLAGGDALSYNLFEIDLVGSYGRLRITDLGETFEIFEVADSPRFSGYREFSPRASYRDGLRDALKHAVDDVVRCLDEGRTPRCSGADGLAALRIAEAVRESVRTGRRVCMEPSHA